MWFRKKKASKLVPLRDEEIRRDDTPNLTYPMYGAGLFGTTDDDSSADDEADDASESDSSDSSGSDVGGGSDYSGGSDSGGGYDGGGGGSDFSG